MFGEPSDNGIAAQLSNLWSAWDSVANNPGDPGARAVLLQQATTLASSINSAAAASLQADPKPARPRSSARWSRRSTRPSASLAQVNQSIQSGTVAGLNVNTLEDQRDQLAQTLAQLTGATIQQGQNNQVTVSLNGLNLVSENHAQALTLDTSGPTAVLRVAQGGFAVNVTSGQAGGMLNDINTVLPGYLTQLDGVATTLRDQVNNVDEPDLGHDRRPRRDQSAAGTLQFGVALDGGAVATVSVAGADWSGAGGAAALQTALQTALNTAIGAGNATATVTTNGDGSLSVAIAPTGTHALQVQASGCERRILDAARHHAGRSRRHRRPGVLRRHRRVDPRGVGPGRRQPGRGRGRRGRQRPARRQHRPAARRHGDVEHRRRRRLQHDDRAARRRREGRADPGQHPATVGSEPRCGPECSSRGQHRRRDDEHGRVPEGVRGLGQVHQTINSMLDTLINMVGP